MKEYIQPFREDRPADICDICRETIFVGDVAYRLDGTVYCYGCVESSAFIADTEGLFPETEIRGRTNV